VTSTETASDHRSEPWYWEAGSEHCPHGPEPEQQSSAWDTWAARHTGSPQDVRICLDAPMGDHCPACSEDHCAPVPWTDCPEHPAAPAAEPYCTGDRCADCTPDEECCEATCGCCPRVDEHDHCRLAPGSEPDSQYCDQHGEGWLYDRSPEPERRYQILRTA
jgi:hypothetical protein